MSETTWTIVPGDLDAPEVVALLRAHLTSAAQWSPPESVHALPIEGLRQPNVTFWAVYRDPDTLVGCGALKALNDTHAEIKSMHTSAAYRKQGVARALLKHIIDVACQRGYTRLSLETGSHEPFAPARALYSSFGFVRCPPFADYREDPLSVCMTLELSSDRRDDF